MNKAGTIPDARIRIDKIHWNVPHYTPSIPQQGIMSKQVLGKTPTELRYFKRSDFMKDANDESLWASELGSQQEKIVPILILEGF